MVSNTDKIVKGFIIFAIIFACVEVIYLVAKGIWEVKENSLFNYVSSVLLAIIIFGESIILFWESNKVVISYFPYTVLLQDLGTHYGILDNTGPSPREQPFRILLKKKGTTGHHTLRKLTFEMRNNYEVIWTGDNDISINNASKIPRNNFMYFEFTFEKTEMKESQLVYEFFIQRNPIAGKSPRDFHCVVSLEYEYKIFLKSLKFRDQVTVPSAIR